VLAWEASRIYHSKRPCHCWAVIILGLSLILLYVLNSLIGVNHILGRILVTGFLLPLDYWLHKHITFSGRFSA